MTSGPSNSVRAVGLFSGGLDSILAVHVLRAQNIAVTAVCFTSPFFSETRGVTAAEKYQIPCRVQDITDEISALLHDPPHGFGKAANPCIDCHAMMFRTAGAIMEEIGADFLFSGEVLNQRPMSQNRNSLKTVARDSGYADQILRPLSALKLPPTPVEEKNLADRSRLCAISGKSRKPQMELADHFGISEYPQPAGGCLLTYKGFGNKVFDLRENNSLTAREMNRLAVGRHFRMSEGIKLIIGKDQEENEQIRKLCADDILLECREIPGPSCILNQNAGTDIIQKALDLCAFYSDADPGDRIRIHMTYRNKTDIREVRAQDCRSLRQETLIK
mgnify:CR=1 FL=1